MTQPHTTDIRRLAALAALALALALAPAAPGAMADDARHRIISGYAGTAKSQNEGFTGFSADRGRALYLSRPAGGKPDTPSCTSCHSADATERGRTRAGKEIAPMAVSRAPDRYTDPAKVEKWFRRNCKSVLGRTCTATEKGDFLTYMTTR